MKIRYTLDDTAARIPLSIRSSDGVWDRSADLRNAPSVRLVELTTQHMLNTGLSLIEELAHYFEQGAPSESDPYALGQCYENRDRLQDLLSDLHNQPPDQLIALHEIEALFPASYDKTIPFSLALTVVGMPAFGYVRTFSDAEGEQFHGLIVNLAQAHQHLEERFGQFSLALLIDTIRDGFFNHEAFRIIYHEFVTDSGRSLNRPVDRLKNTLLSRGIAWYLSYRRDLTFYDEILGLNTIPLDEHAAVWNRMIDAARRKAASDQLVEDWLEVPETRHPGESCIDIVGYFAARAIAEQHGVAGLREAITAGPDHFITLYNALGQHQLQR